jgi:hypothetical protein
MTIELIYFGICAGLFGLAVFLGIRWYALPRLVDVPLAQSLPPLLLLSTLRVNGLFFIVPGVAATDIPSAFAVPTAYGDALSAFLALAAAIALRSSLSAGVLLAWLYNVVGSLDLANAFLQTALHDVQPRHFGATWFLSAINVPGLINLHLLMFILLIRKVRNR